MKKPIDGVDFLKLLLSFVIVAIHSEFLSCVIFPLARLAVPTFFVLSGYFAFVKINSQQTSQQKQSTLWKIVKRYLQLYLFWLIVLSPIVIYIGEYYKRGLLESTLDLIHNFLFDSTFPSSWYIMACVLGITIIYFLSRKLDNLVLLAVTIPIYVFVTLISQFTSEIKAHPVLNDIYSFFVMILGTPYWNFMVSLIYILIGKMIAERKLSNCQSKKFLIGLLACVVGLFLERWAWSRIPTFRNEVICYFMLPPTAAFLVLWVMHLNVNIKHAAAYRKISTITYCIHYSVVKVISEIMSILRVSDPHRILLFFSASIISVCVGLVILKLEKSERLSILKYSH